ncbi:hypothetical protein ABT158_15720 [Nonomuraea sp. NPDC001636]|uniref:hypothetical protein n=1 Tax=Nonomuraea sp. NPDC001636 TaxID=3154391 RepID=UPI003326F1F2
MSRRRTITEVLIGALFTLAALSIATAMAVAYLTPWPREVALWLSGTVTGLFAGPPLRAWLALVAARLAGMHAVPVRTPRRHTSRSHARKEVE